MATDANNQPALKDRGGLNGIESLMLLVIIAIIVGFSVVKFNDWRAKHRDSERKKDIATLQQRVAQYYALKGHYPISLSDISGLPTQACQSPRGNGSCAHPDYTYKAFRAGTKVTFSSKTNCTNKTPKTDCANYLIYTDQIELANNPYFVRSH